MSLIPGPTMANPEAFSTVEALRRELRRTNELLLAQFLDLAHLTEGAEQMAETLNALLIADLTGDTSTISKVLHDYLAPRDSLREQLEERIKRDHLHNMH
jgi:hypothetical protein